MEMTSGVQSGDVKVILANFFCMLMVQMEALSHGAQLVLILSTIFYTLTRAANEIKKYRRKDNDDKSSD